MTFAFQMAQTHDSSVLQYGATAAQAYITSARNFVCHRWLTPDSMDNRASIIHADSAAKASGLETLQMCL